MSQCLLSAYIALVRMGSQVSAPMAGDSQPLVTPATRDLTHLLCSTGTCTHLSACTRTQAHTHTWGRRRERKRASLKGKDTVLWDKKKDALKLHLRKLLCSFPQCPMNWLNSAIVLLLSLVPTKFSARWLLCGSDSMLLLHGPMTLGLNFSRVWFTEGLGLSSCRHSRNPFEMTTCHVSLRQLSLLNFSFSSFLSQRTQTGMDCRMSAAQPPERRGHYYIVGQCVVSCLSPVYLQTNIPISCSLCPQQFSFLHSSLLLSTQY